MLAKLQTHIKTLHTLSVLTITLMAFGWTSCASDMEDPKIDFVGDSIVARWDINQDFPSFYVYNYGVGGSGVELLESYKSKFNGNDVVVLSGTNDNYSLTLDRRDEYAKKYISAILSLTDRRIFLFSVLPRSFDGDRSQINCDIQDFNLQIQNLVRNIGRITYLDVYSDFMKGESIDMRYFSDGLHPNTIGYEILTQKLLEAL